MNRYSRDTSFRERPVTVAPLPFEAMYKSLQDKQARYDQAEAFEIQNQSAVSALSSPISGYQAYLDNFKTNYLSEAEALHKSIPDKGSSEYRRKLQELVGKYSSDRNRQLIERDSQNYLQFIKDKSDLLKQGKYSNWRNSQYEGFTGKGPNGEILPFVYTGVQAAKDVNNLINHSISNTPEEKGKTSYFDSKRNQQIEIEEQGKRPDKMLNSLLTTLGPDGMKDWQESLGIKDDKIFDEYVSAFTTSKSNYVKNITSKNDFSAENNARARFNFAKENAPEPINFSKIDNLPNINRPDFIDDDILDDGSFNTTFNFMNMFGEGDTFNTSDTYERNKQYYSEIINNGRQFGLSTKEALKLAKNGRKLSNTSIMLNDKQAEEAASLISRNINNEQISLVRVDGENAAPATMEERQAIFNNATNPGLKKDQRVGFVVSQALTDDNSFGPNSYLINSGGVQYVASLGITGRDQASLDKQNEYLLAKAHSSTGLAKGLINYKEFDNSGKLIALHPKADAWVNPLNPKDIKIIPKK